VNYAFANVSQDGRCFEANVPGEGDAWADYQRPASAAVSVDGVADSPDPGPQGQLQPAPQAQGALPAPQGAAVDRWLDLVDDFSNAAHTSASRRAFVASCIDLFIKGNLPQLGSVEGGPGSAAGVFDGIDLDWEWPGSEGEPGNVIRPEDKRNFTLLLAEFRRQLDAYGRERGRYQLTAFLPADPLAVRRHHLLDLRRPGVDAPEDRIHQAQGPGRRHGVVAGRRRRGRHADRRHPPRPPRPALPVAPGRLAPAP
jgi:chitinase